MNSELMKAIEYMCHDGFYSFVCEKNGICTFMFISLHFVVKHRVILSNDVLRYYEDR